MSKTTKIIWGIVVVVIILAVITSSKKGSDQVVKIGVITPLSGSAGAIGEEVLNSIKLASSSKYLLIAEDDQCDSKKAISSYNKLKIDGVKVFYVSCSGSVMALASIAKTDGNLIITAFAGSAEIRKTGTEVIRLIPDAISIADAISEYVSANNIKYGLIYEEQDYAKSTAMRVKEKVGDKIAFEDKYSSNDSSFRTQISKLKSSKVDALIYIPTSDKIAKIFFNELKTLGANIPIIGDVNVCEYPFKPSDFGIKYTCFDMGFERESIDYLKFKDEYKNKYNQEVNYAFFDAISYDLFVYIDKYLESNSNKLNTANFKKELLDGFTGKMSDYKFDSSGKIIPSNNIKKITG